METDSDIIFLFWLTTWPFLTFYPLVSLSSRVIDLDFLFLFLCLTYSSSSLSDSDDGSESLLSHRKQPPGVFCRKGVLRNFTKFTGKHLCQSLFFDKVASLRPATLLKKRLWYRCFPVNFVKFQRTPFFIEHLWWLLLSHHQIVYSFKSFRFSLGFEKNFLCYFTSQILKLGHKSTG